MKLSLEIKLLSLVAAFGLCLLALSAAVRAETRHAGFMAAPAPMIESTDEHDEAGAAFAAPASSPSTPDRQRAEHWDVTVFVPSGLVTTVETARFEPLFIQWITALRTMSRSS